MALGSSLYVENEVLHVGHLKWQMPHAIRRYQKSIWKRKNWNPWKQAGWGSVRNLYVVNWMFMFYIICISPFGFLQMLWKILNLCIAFSAALGLTEFCLRRGVIIEWGKSISTPRITVSVTMGNLSPQRHMKLRETMSCTTLPYSQGSPDNAEICAFVLTRIIKLG